jgi:MFS family permease
MVVAVPLGALVAKKCPSVRVVALVALGGSLLLPLAQSGILGLFGSTMARTEFPWDLLFASILAIVPAAAASSLLFPWLLARWERADRIGELVAANLVGGLAGALVAGWITLPWMGLHAAVWVVSLGWCAIVVVYGREGFSRWIGGTAAVGLSVLGWYLWAGPLAPRPDYQVLERLDGWSGRVELVERERHQFLLYNGSYALGGTRSVLSHVHQAQVAMALRPHARDVFVLGLGTGVTAGALTGSVELRRARVVELLPQVERLARMHFAPYTGSLFSDPRFSIEVGDARTALRADTAKYDLVLGDLFLPWLPGAELLVCREHFLSVRDHLRSDGLFVQWFPLYQLTEPVFLDILATAKSVFGEVHLFRESQDPDGPLVALVAAPPGGFLSAPGGSSEILQLWSGSTSGMPALEGIPPTTFANRQERMLSRGGLYPAQPSADQAISGARWSEWMGSAILAKPIEEVGALQGFGPEAWKQIAYGFLRSREIALRKAGQNELADSAASQAHSLLPGAAVAE